MREVVTFLLDVEDGKREILDCETCTRPQPASCPACPLTLGHQPKVPQWLTFYMTLHKRVKRWGALPGPGGILDQQETTMMLLDMIEDVIDERNAEKRRAEEATLKREADEAKRRSRRGR